MHSAARAAEEPHVHLPLVSLVVWLYFTEGVVRAWSDRAPGNYLAMLELALCLSLFTACTLHVRLRQRHAKAAGLTEPPVSAAP